MKASSDTSGPGLAAFLVAVPLAGGLGIISIVFLILLHSPRWALLAGASGFSILLAALALAVWRAHHRQNTVLRDRVENLESEVAASREKLRHFLSGAAHDLSQPLTTLYGTLELALASKTTPAGAHSILEDALQQARCAMVLTRLLSELAVAGENGNSARASSLPGFVREASEDLSTVAQVRNVRFVVHCESSPVVLAIPTDLRRSLYYLVEHALERSPTDGIVKIRVEQENSHAIVVITDEGAAISPEDLPHWFEPFRSRLNGATAKRDALRLAIVEKACASCWGSVTAANSPEGGARFILRLPLA